MFHLPPLPPKKEIETTAVLKQLVKSHRHLAELKGVAKTIPNEHILINTLTLQEAKASSEVEHIVTTHDELYKENIFIDSKNPESKEVLNYNQGLMQNYKTNLRTQFPKIYSQDLLNNLFKNPYTKIEFLQEDLRVSKRTAQNYLDVIAEENMLEKIKVGRSNYYINLIKVLMDEN